MESTDELTREVWRRLFVPDELIRALVKAKFTQPTPIQSSVLPAAIRDHSDVLGSAPTGSGKTLAFGIPLLARVMELRLQETSLDPPTVKSVETTDSPMEIASIEEGTQSKINSKKKQSLLGTDFNPSFNRSNYLNLAVIEELDVDTGEVRAVHSLADQTLTDSEDFTSMEVGKQHKETGTKRVYALVLLPTRELALQVCHHLRMLAEFVEPCIRIEAIVGGISMQKQTRLLSYKPHVIVATPGRLWQFIQQAKPHLCTVREANFLVVDEADKLVEANHFEDLRELFTWLCVNPSRLTNHSDVVDCVKPIKRRQTAVFSATLTFVHRGALKPGTGAKHRKQFKSRDGLTKELKLSALRDLFGLSPRAKVFDLSSTPIPSEDSNGDVTTETQGSLDSVACPEGLREYRLLCTDQPSKDMRLFWFLAFGRHQPMTEERWSPGNQRCLIFINSKSGVRRLAGVMRQLTQSNSFAVSNYPQPRYVNVLHADMLQKHRLRALERFQADANGILLASDVASRGLDLASQDHLNYDNGVAWVVHFDVPRTAELYIHRRGRTARAYRAGTSVLFICPDEIPLWRRLALSLKRVDPDLCDFPLDPCQFQLTACEKLVELAKRLDLMEHTASREKANEDWFSQAAKSADILLQSDGSDDDNDYEGMSKSKRRRRGLDDTKRQAMVLRAELRQLVLACRKSLSKKSLLSSTKVANTTRSLKKQLKCVREQPCTGKSTVTRVIDL
ncbi:DEAD-box ATP-dependent RNA helicase 13 [Fasciola hepatica]|uniref:ATP-dependent RNA helicase n=1 Tax=Fasciola hepatica TaxID=6192 RepID=A0A4E0RY66_FASHE|nr:DEAD-box ATP-dependent RNA helicase 13 [Fasciola hepatica]